MAAIIGILEGLTHLTARSVKEFIGSNAAKKGIGWFTENKLEEILSDEQKSNLLQEQLKRVNQEYETTNKDGAMKVTVATGLEHLNTRIFQAEIDISQKFQLLQTILANNESTQKRNIEVERLRNGILDTNSGVLNNLSVIHKVLVGQTVDPSKKGLLEMWSKGVNTNMLENPISAKTCYDQLMHHLTRAAILQLKGFLLFKGANDDVQFCCNHFKLFEDNLKYQSDLMEKTMPKHMKYLTDPKEENVFYLRPVFGTPFEPFVKRRSEGKTLQFEYYLEHVAEERWTFEKSSTFNTDGSLYISGITNGKAGSKRNFLSFKDNNKAICVSNEGKPQSFYVMPLYKENSMHITICKLEQEPDSSPRFLGNDLKFIGRDDNIEFTITKPADITERESKWQPMRRRTSAND